MKIAIIGGGVSGLVAAYLLHESHDVVLFEAQSSVGGHAHTVEIREETGNIGVDTGFVVFNERHYPKFSKLLSRLEVESLASDMSFSVRCEKTGLEYNGSSLNRFFAQRRNILSPRFWKLLTGIAHFHVKARSMADFIDPELTISDFLRRHNFSEIVTRQYLLPLTASIWSTSPHLMSEFPARFMIQFLNNHGMLDLVGSLKWRSIRGGAREYVRKLTAPFLEKIRLNSPVRMVERGPRGVQIKTDGNEREHFDEVIFAVPSHRALSMLVHPTSQEQAVLGAIRFQSNRTTLHTDPGFLPERKLAWASWNYHIPAQEQNRVEITYYMNKLQNLASKRHYCVTLNRSGLLNPETVLGRFDYEHPLYTPGAARAQTEHSLISGRNRTHFCGAYWGYGFHEDGVRSALRVCRRFGKDL